MMILRTVDCDGLRTLGLTRALNVTIGTEMNSSENMDLSVKKKITRNYGRYQLVGGNANSLERVDGLNGDFSIG